MYLDYQSFINCIIELLNEQTEEGTWIEIGHQLRNNGVNHDSFVFRRQNEPIAPSIPAACFYEAYQKGSCPKGRLPFSFCPETSCVRTQMLDLRQE